MQTKCTTAERTLIKAKNNLVSRHSDIEKVVRILFIEKRDLFCKITPNNATGEKQEKVFA